MSEDAFRSAWARSRDSSPQTAGAPGIDWMEAAIFSSDLKVRVADLRTSIRNNSFHFNQLRLARVIKPSGDFRILAIPTVRDRLLQRTLLDHLAQDARFPKTSSISYGFSKGRTLADAQRRALSLRQERPWVLQADIVRFFDNIPRELLRVMIRRRVSWKVVADLLCAAVDCEIDTSKPDRKRLVDDAGIRRGLGLRQGMPVSPALSNLLLKNFDELLVSRGFTAVRYADDIAIFGHSRSECEEALTVIQEGLSKLSLKISDLSEDGKTRILSPSESALFLGVDIVRFPDGYRLRAPTKKLKEIEASMAKMSSLQTCLEDKRNLGQVVRSLDSIVVGHAASMAVLDDGGEFIARLVAAKQKVLKGLLCSIFGEAAVARLTQQQLAILGIGSF